MRVYLAHPFLDKAYGRELQTKIESLGIEVENPFLKVIENLYKPEVSNPQISQRLVEGDLRLIEQVDAIVAICNDKASIGTHMEVFYASRILRKPVFVLYQKSYPPAIHPWYEFLALNFRTEAELLDELAAWSGTK